jgi:steroid delta-isomerase-like uncharacterized protein
MPKDFQNLIDSLLELWNTGRAEAAAQLYAEAVQRLDPNLPDPARGRQEVTQYVSQVRSGFPDFKLQIRNAIADDSYLVTHWTCTGTHKGDFLGIPATGKPIEISGMSLARVEGGKVVEERTYFDRLTMLEQLGVSTGMPDTRAMHAGQSSV